MGCTVNQYPLDDEGIGRVFNQLLEHNRAQSELVNRLADYLKQALTYVEEDCDDDTWFEETEMLLKNIHKRKIDFDNFRFDQKNGHKLEDISPYAQGIEEGFGDTMTEEELARHFGEPLPKKPKKSKSIDKMSLEEIEAWEAAQNGSNDIYKVAARMKNAARMAVQGNLTPQGEMVVNTFAHMVKAFYDFANVVSDKETQIRLTELIKKQEELPANLISALWAGVKEAKD